MSVPIDPSQSGNREHKASDSTGTVRLFNLDLPAIKKTGNVFPEQPNLSAVHRILDVACGDGTWAIWAARAYPHTQVVGIDGTEELIDHARAQAHESGVRNVSFSVMTPLQLFDLPDGSFDLVNLRFMVGFTSLAAWPMLVEESLRVIRSGGVIRLTEGDIPITNSPAFEHLNDLLSRALWQAGHHLSPPTQNGQNLLITPLLPRLLRNAGCAEIRRAPYVTNFSAATDAHADMAQDVARSYQLMQPFLVQMDVTKQEQVEQAYQRMLTEMQSADFRAVGLYLTAWGTKR